MFFTSRLFYLILVLIFALFYIFTNLAINNDVSTAAGGVQEEFITEYLMGKNFALKGFSRLYFLPDQSTDFIENSPPLLYTHNPPIPSLLHGLLIKLGLNLLQSRIFYIFISLTGFAFLYLFIANIASVTAAVFVSVLLIINFNGFLSFIDHNHYALSFPLLFIYLWAYSAQSPKKYFVIPIIFLISSWTSYMFLSFMMILGLLFFIFNKDKKLFFYSISAAVAGISLHLIQNIIALGPALAWQDLWFTIQNRMYGTPTRQELLSFYQNHNLALWGGQKLIASQSIIGYFRGVIAPLVLFKTPLIIAIIATLTLYFKRQGNFYKNRKILIPIFSAFLIWRMMIEQTIGVYPPIFHIFLAIFLGIILSDLITGVFMDYPINLRAIPGFIKMRSMSSFGVEVKNIAIKILILIAIVLIIFKYFNWAGKIGDDAGLSNLLRISEKYRQKTFFTNIFMPNTISFKTGTWAIGGCLPEGLLNIDASSCYSKVTTRKNEDLMPDYILLSTQSFAFDCSEKCYADLKENLNNKYQFIEETSDNDIVIFQVKK